MHSLESICNALAMHYAGTAIGTPTGASAMRATYAQWPNNIPSTPCAIIAPMRGEFVDASDHTQIKHEIDVLFYVSKRQGDLPRSETERQKWLPYLLMATLSATHLGLASTGGVEYKSTLPSGYEFTTLNYGGDEYDGIVVHLEALVFDRSVTKAP